MLFNTCGTYTVLFNTCCTYTVLLDTCCTYTVLFNTCCTYTVLFNTCCTYTVLLDTYMPHMHSVKNSICEMGPVQCSASCVKLSFNTLECHWFTPHTQCSVWVWVHGWMFLGMGGGGRNAVCFFFQPQQPPPSALELPRETPPLPPRWLRL